jgi:hypothetical protein
MGVLDLAEVDAETLLDKDNRVAEDFDARRWVDRRLAGGAAPAGPPTA